MTSLTVDEDRLMVPRTSAASSAENGSAWPCASACSRSTSARAAISYLEVKFFSSRMHLSKTRANGYAMGLKRTTKSLTNQTKRLAICSLAGPVKIAEGMISPTNKTAVTEIKMASHSATSLSRKSGSASLEMEFKRRSVTMTWCRGSLSTMPSSLAQSRCWSGVPARIFTRRSIGSSDKMPIVSPAARPADVMHRTVPHRFSKPAPLINDSSSASPRRRRDHSKASASQSPRPPRRHPARNASTSAASTPAGAAAPNSARARPISMRNRPAY
mmetsp:Transcript_19714/g.66698  ORF Transcript_19714/g.66698 Transcript_19714/m.66698 type:complete len:273 (+) Transcript_19714:674-1492(+)